MAAPGDIATQPTAESDIAPLLAGYRPLPGIFDEMVDRDGRVREHWRPFLAMLAGLGAKEISRRFAAADRHLHESGVFYRVYEDPVGAARPWPMSHLPLLIDAAEWRRLEAGLVQRAQLLEAVLADAYRHLHPFPTRRSSERPRPRPDRARGRAPRFSDQRPVLGQPERWHGA